MQQDQPANKSKPKGPQQRLVLGAVVLILVLLLAGAALLVTKLSDDKKTTKQKPSATNQSQPTAAIQSAGAVTITKDGFTPATIKVKSGQSVTWTNTDDKPHQPATDPYPAQDGLAGFKSEEPLAKTETYSYTFDKPGTYSYHDNLNPLKLKGTVVVE